MRRYNKWAGNPEGNPEDPTKCAAEILDQEIRFPTFRQCQRKRSVGLLCAQHARLKEKSKTVHIPKDEK